MRLCAAIEYTLESYKHAHYGDSDSEGIIPLLEK